MGSLITSAFLDLKVANLELLEHQCPFLDADVREGGQAFIRYLRMIKEAECDGRDLIGVHVVLVI